jgi:eukaryotic-like serine/threonine-protein kinase
MTSETNTCRQCGAVIPATSTETLCPACLMSMALNAPGDPTETGSMAPNDSLSLYGPTDLPCEVGDYRLLGLLGRGGMGTVYEAEQLSTGRRVALKMLGQQLDSPDMRQRFLREGRLAAGVNHPNSLYVFGSEEIEGLPVITMEIAGSGTLKDQLKQRGPLPVAEAVDAILDIISGLESAFAGGVLHRDIKPSNCFVCPDGSVKVGDFGLSVSTLSRDDTFVTAHGKIMGTPAYASPEQLRGDALDLRADIYSVGATLFTLLTNRAPFEGDNAVQVVANAVNKKPPALTELRDDIAPGLERVVTRCLGKEPEARYRNYPALRTALLPFSSREPKPASLKLRASTGWIDYLIAFLIPYVTLMLCVGGEALLISPLMERTLYSARYYLLLFSVGCLYFSLAEGIWGGGLGMRLKGLQVVRRSGRRPGIGRALLRILIPIGCIEGVRMPLMLATLPNTDWTGATIAWFIIATNLCAWIPVLLTLRAHRENGYTTVWDLASGTRVVVKPQGSTRQALTLAAGPELTVKADKGTGSLGPYRIIKEIVPNTWIAATDPVLRRRVWLIRRTSSNLSPARQNLARQGRLRWLQKVEATESTWDAFEAHEGIPFSILIEHSKRIAWANLRHWLSDLATELWDATGDHTLPPELSLDHVWITTQGRAVLLDQPWPLAAPPAESIPVDTLIGQQRFLSAVNAVVETTSLPLHARGVLTNLREGKFEKLSFLTGTLRGLLDRPVQLNQGIRTGSIFMLPVFMWILVYVGHYHSGGDAPMWQASLIGHILFPAMVVLGVLALLQLVEFPFGNTASYAIFRLAVINAQGKRAGLSVLYLRWAIVWLPLFVPISVLALLTKGIGQPTVIILALIWLVLWISVAAYAAVHPKQGLHNRLARTWVVRQ